MRSAFLPLRAVYASPKGALGEGRGEGRQRQNRPYPVLLPEGEGPHRRSVHYLLFSSVRDRREPSIHAGFFFKELTSR